jgi:hypothetical protein
VQLAQAGGPIEQAVAELRALAAGRGDLLAEQAGIMVGAWSARVDTRDHLLAAALLMLAGADHDAIARRVDVGRERAMTPATASEGAGSGQNAPLFTTVHSTITQPAGAGQWRDRDHLRRPAARVEVRVVSRWQRARSSARSRSR